MFILGALAIWASDVQIIQLYLLRDVFTQQ